MKKLNQKPSVLIVDDDKSTRDGLEQALKPDYDVISVESAARALTALGESSVDVMLADVRMPGMDGLDLLRRTAARHPDVICILLTAYGNVETAVEAMKLGAHDFLTKPVNLDHLDLLLKRALRLRDVESENVNLRTQLDDKYRIENIIGNSAPMREVFETIRQAAPTQATVLIQGESGTGKELVAHAIHRLSECAHGPFIAVHCAALAPTLLESELFGHEKGSFTGASALRRGRFEMADGGTLFLDEVSEIDPSVQVKLLRVLEERKFERVGGADTIETDIRLIAATNANLRALVEQGKFRDDLFFRLDVVSIGIPPLRDRLDDVPVLCSHFLGEFAEKNNRAALAISPEALSILSSYSWPGNVRELRNTMEKMAVLARGSKLTARDVPENIRKQVETLPGAQKGIRVPGIDTLNLTDAENKMILSALEKNNGNRTKAAQELGISRRTLHRRLNEMHAPKKGPEARVSAGAPFSPAPRE